METQIIHLKPAGENEYWNYFELLQEAKKENAKRVVCTF